MKKLMYFILIVTLFVSCSNLNSKLEDAITKEIGKEPVKNEAIDNTTQIIIWENVSIEKQNSIKNSVDKVFGALPLKESHNEEIGEFDANDKYICNGIKSSYMYENHEYKVDLTLTYRVEKHEIETLPDFFEFKYTTDYEKPIDIELSITTK